MAVNCGHKMCSRSVGSTLQNVVTAGNLPQQTCIGISRHPMPVTVETEQLQVKGKWSLPFLRPQEAAEPNNILLWGYNETVLQAGVSAQMGLGRTPIPGSDLL